MNKIIDGKLIADNIKQDIKKEIKAIDDQLKLTVIQVGDNPASNIYVRKKKELCEEMGINCDIKKYGTISEQELINEIKRLNNDKEVTSILVQLPLPENINETNVIEAIDPKKDVDGLTSTNLGKMFSKQKGIRPCTALGVIKMLQHENIEIRGKDVCVVGRSRLVGTPLIALLLNNDATVTVCHTKTKDLKEKTSKADILIVAIGQKEYITKDMVKEGSVIIDVGINRFENKLYGDVNFNDVYDKCARISPVPKGVGPMTVIMLINNIIECYKNQK